MMLLFYVIAYYSQVIFWLSYFVIPIERRLRGNSSKRNSIHHIMFSRQDLSSFTLGIRPDKKTIIHK